MRKFWLALTLVALTGGCCTTRDGDTQVSAESYKAALTKVQSNLKDRIRPALADLLDKDTTHGDAWKSAKLGLIDDTLTLCSDTLAGKNAVAPVGSAK